MLSLIELRHSILTPNDAAPSADTMLSIKFDLCICAVSSAISDLKWPFDEQMTSFKLTDGLLGSLDTARIKIWNVMKLLNS